MTPYKCGSVSTSPPCYIVPDYAKNILTKDFDYSELINSHLIRNAKLTLTFISVEIKIIFVVDCLVNLQRKVKEKCQREEAVDIKEFFECFTMGIIRSCTFDLKSLVKVLKMEIALEEVSDFFLKTVGDIC
ncbi:hypothetical protein BDFB_005837 [Asbolus verrucosus]|uniref:Uncharacterized protein n=1 Tax=Asbolus verrucosus TaxID=1661398 RepID=A0A482VDG9_ASBVE|nr:hypothetical protein BDFB_005837 [Asbolus verrucosus]